MTIERSHGKRRPRPARADRPRSPAAELAAPFKDPATGRWTAGNPGGRMRQLAALAKAEAASLLRLDVPHVAPWLRPHLHAAQSHAQALIDALPVQTDELAALCGDEARARLMAAAAFTEGAREGCSPAEAREWRDEARAWLREARQIVLTRRAVIHETELPDPRRAHDQAARAFARPTLPAAASSVPSATSAPSGSNGVHKPTEAPRGP